MAHTPSVPEADELVRYARKETKQIQMIVCQIDHISPYDAQAQELTTSLPFLADIQDVVFSYTKGSVSVRREDQDARFWQTRLQSPRTTPP